jgi:hypothetical protein
MVNTGIEKYEVIRLVVRTILVDVMNVVAFRNRAIMRFPYSAV